MIRLPLPLKLPRAALIFGIFFILVLAFLQLSLMPDIRALDLPDELARIKKQVPAEHDRFVRVAAAVKGNRVLRADRESVHYQSGGRDVETDWETAVVAQPRLIEIREFLRSTKVLSLWSQPETTRVNFVLVAEGLAVSGVSLGMLLSSSEDAGCTRVVTSIDPTMRGLTCELIQPETYLYVDR